ncbi:hypothetical protein GCM10009104_18200 [Marinobacterium maritimum]|uniref:Type II secretion system protein GspB C-terminal domain-containing protein n=1 Tax=Marinobacterium maritimum TaxID=500162 RepID=A0ABN1I660_9GAMM
MSYIHDALKASSEQRKAAQVENGAATAVPTSAAKPAKTGWSLGRILLILLLGLLLYWFWRFPDQQSAVAPVVTDEPEAVTLKPQTPEAEEPDLSGVKIAIRKEPARLPTPARPEVAESRSVAPPASVEPPGAPEPVETVQQEAVEQDPYAGLPYLRQLPVEQQRELQGIRFNVHIYSDEPRSRLVKFEDRVLREGDFVRPGVRIVEIIPRAVVLQYRDTRFKVPAL